jgi:hypothetical protein
MRRSEAAAGDRPQWPPDSRPAKIYPKCKISRFRSGCNSDLIVSRNLNKLVIFATASLKKCGRPAKLAVAAFFHHSHRAFQPLSVLPNEGSPRRAVIF